MAHRKEEDSRRKAPESPEKPAFYMEDTIKRLNIDFSDPRRRLFADWDELGLGEIGEHCRPFDLKRGCLSIKCDSGAWAAAMQFKRGEALYLIRQKYPSLDIQSVRIWA